MTDSLRKLFDSTKLGAAEPKLVKVLISLNAAPNESCLASLKKIGLAVDTVTGNKLTGEIRSQLIAELEKHDAVVDVERSVKLKPTDTSD